MSTITASTPPGTKAAILNAVLDARHKWEHPIIAHRFAITLEELQLLLRDGGYPDTNRMRRRAQDYATAAAATFDPEPENPLDADPAGIEGSRLTKLPIDQLHPDPDNPRTDLTDIEDLADSIKSVGLLQPIVARPDGDRLIVVAGHRRLAAVRHLKWTHVDVIVRAPMRPDHVLLAMLVENGQRAGLDPIEEARALNRLKHSMGIGEAEVARRIGRPLSFVTGRIMLLSLPLEEQEQVRAGVATLTAAKAKARIESGRIRPNAIGRTPPAHLSAGHPLAERVRVRCVQAKHSRGKGMGVGGIGCGACWEAVIRADERERTQAASADAGRCLTCGTDHQPIAGVA